MGDARRPNMSTLSERHCRRNRQPIFHHYAPMVRPYITSFCVGN